MKGHRVELIIRHVLYGEIYGEIVEKFVEKLEEVRIE